MIVDEMTVYHFRWLIHLDCYRWGWIIGVTIWWLNLGGNVCLILRRCWVTSFFGGDWIRFELVVRYCLGCCNFQIDVEYLFFNLRNKLYRLSCTFLLFHWKCVTNLDTLRSNFFIQHCLTLSVELNCLLHFSRNGCCKLCNLYDRCVIF